MSSYNSGDYEDALEKLDNSGVFKSEDFLLKCMYAQAEEAYNAGDYVRAVNKFEDLSKTNYSDSTERMNSAKYAYVLKFVDVNKFEYKGEFSYSNTYVFRVFKQYLLDLKEIKYKNSATIYEKMLNKWKAEIIINHCDDWDWYTEADSVSIYDNSIKIYSVIYSLSDESVNIKWWYFFPKGNWYPYYPEEEKYYKLSCYDRTGFSTEPDNYYLSGTNNYFEVQLLNRDTGEKIGEKKILMNSEIR